MKLSLSITSVLSTIFLATAALAQSANIGYPTDGTTIQRGTNITVRVDRPDTLTGSTEVAIVLALSHCSGDVSTCIPESEFLGSVLYYGPYHPEFTTGSSASLPPHQNFTVFVPANQPTGTGLLSLTHLSLVGAGPFPLFELGNVTVNVV